VRISASVAKRRGNAFFVHPANRFFMLVFYGAGGIAPAGATKGLSDRPLEPFGVRTFGVDFFRKN